VFTLYSKSLKKDQTSRFVGWRTLCILWRRFTTHTAVIQRKFVFCYNIFVFVWNLPSNT